MEEQVRKMIAQYISVPEDSLQPESSLQGDIGLNSLDVINLIVDFEETFNIEIDEADLRGLQTVQDLTSYVASRAGEKHA